MAPFFELFDDYSRQARLFPALLTTFPPLLAVLAWFPELLTSSVGATLLTVGTSCGLLYLLASLARTRGKAVEGYLLKKLGGWPTTIILRHNNDRLDEHTRKRYHQFLSKNVQGLKLPTIAQQLDDPTAADRKYKSAIKWLKERTRKEKFSIVEKENAQYGFRRNLRGMRAIGILSCIVTIIASGAAILNRQPEIFTAIFDQSASEIITQLKMISPILSAALAVNLVAIVGWIFLIRDKWVEEAGYQYATALLATCDRMSQQQ